MLQEALLTPCQPWAASLNLHFPQGATTGTAQEHHCEHRQLSVNQGASYSHPNDIPTQHQLAPSARQQDSHFHPTWRGSSDRWQDLPPASQLIFTQSACFNKISQCCSKADNLQLPCTKLVTRVGEPFLLEGKCLVPLRLAGTELCSGISLKMLPGVLGEHLHLHHHTPPCSKIAASFLWCKWGIMLQWFCKTSIPMQYF